MALCRQVQLHRRLDAYRQHVLFQQERGNIEGEWREVPVVTAQQPAVQPDVGHQECAVETQEGALAAPWRRGTTAGAQASSSKSSLGKPRSSPSPRVAIAVRHPALSSCRFNAWDGNSDRQSLSAMERSSHCSFWHDAIDSADAIKRRRPMKFLGVALAEML